MTKTAKAKKESETVEIDKTMINTTATLMMNQKITSTMSSNDILLPTLSDMWLVLDAYIVRDVGGYHLAYIVRSVIVRCVMLIQHHLHCA